MILCPALDLSLSELDALADAADGQSVWPTRSLEIAQSMGAYRWNIPKEYGGSGLSALEWLSSNERLAGACLTTCFILSQRDSAIRRILASENSQLCTELLPDLAEGKTFATVGLSQLTTSRQHGQPVFVAREEGDDIVLHGTIPWVTGAGEAQHVIVGATLENEVRQVLLVLPMHSPGITVDKPMSLMALQGSLTTEIHCDNVRVNRRWLLAGPEEKVMAGKGGGAGGVNTSCLALGLSGAIIRFLRKESESRSGLNSGVERLEETLVKLRNEMHHLLNPKPNPEDLIGLRAQANTLVVQSAQASLLVSKGAGFVRNHPAQRWVRQAMFFLVWSCPWPAASATLDFLNFGVDQECL